MDSPPRFSVPGELGAVERTGDLAERLGAEHGGVGHRLVDDRLGRRVGRVVAGVCSPAAGLFCCSRRPRRCRVHGEQQLVEVVAVLTGRDHRTGGHRTALGHPARNRYRVVVGQVGVTGDDRVDVVVDTVDDLAEVAGRVGRRDSAVVSAPSCTSRMTMSAPGALSLSASRLAATTGARSPVRNAGRETTRQMLGDRADEADLHATEVLDPGLGKRGSGRGVAGRCHPGTATPHRRRGWCPASYGAITRFTRSL